MIFWLKKNHFLMAWATVAWATFAFVASLFSVVTMTLIASAVVLFGFFVVLFAVFFGFFVGFTVVLFAVFFGDGSSDNDAGGGGDGRGDCCGSFDTLFVGAFCNLEDITKGGSRVCVHSGFNVLHPFIHVILYV